MKVQKKLVIIFVLVVSHTFLYGQGNEAVLKNSGVDSIPEKQNSKTTEIVAVSLPSAMITYGLISLGDNGIRKFDHQVQNSLKQNNRFWHSHVADYLQYSPAVAAYTLKVCNLESAHNLLDMTILYGLSNLLAGGIVQGGKIITGRERPDNSNNHSFPSGHTQTAFVAAEFLYQEYKDQSAWISIGGYGVAIFVGIARVYNNRHWVSDVVAGAGIGILSTKAVYWAYPYLQKTFGKKEKPLQTIIFPGYNNGNMSLTLSKTF